MTPADLDCGGLGSVWNAGRAFRLIVTSVALDGQARKAEADSVRLDAGEALALVSP